MNCRRAEKLILKSPDEELSRTERERMDVHLGVCAACREAEEDHRRLTLLARRWVPRTAPTDLPPDVFAAQVLARLSEGQKTTQPSLWLPALAASSGVAALALLPHTLRPTLPDMGEAAQFLPGWLLSTVRALPADTLTVWQSAQGISFPAQWLGVLLAGACMLNAIFYAHTIQLRLKGSRL